MREEIQCEIYKVWFGFGRVEFNHSEVEV